MSILGTFYNLDVINNNNFKYSPSGDYFAPDGNYEDYVEYIKSLPIDPLPEVFGLHDNADIARQQAETQQLFDSVLITLPRDAGGSGASTQGSFETYLQEILENRRNNQEKSFKRTKEIIEQMSKDLLTKIPPMFDTYTIGKKFPIVYEESMNTVLKQELIRYNR